MAAEVDSSRAWTVVAAVAVANGFGFGITYSFGSFFEAMAAEFDTGRGATALVFGLTLLLFFGFGAVSGPLADRFGPRRMLMVGSVLFCGGLLVTSRVDSVVQGYFTYSLGVGLGAGCWVTPLLAAVAGWFQRRRAVALGVAATGSGMGTLVLAPLAARLIEVHGWRNAYMILAALAAAGLSVAIALVSRPPVPPPTQARAHLRAVGATPEFRLLFVSGLLMSIGLFVAFAFVVPFATDRGITSARAALLVGLIGASSIVGRVGLTALAGRLGPIRLYQLCLLAQPVAYVIWFAAGGRYPLLVAFTVLLGVTYGGFVALGPEVVAHLFGVRSLGAMLGLVYFGSGIGGLVGPVAAGALADATDGQGVPIGSIVVVTALAAALTFLIPQHRAPSEREVAAGAP